MIASTSKITIALAASFFRGLYTVDYATQSAALMIVTIPQLIIFIIFQRYVIEGITAGAIKG
jgi:raffinose/stachyose/melibiose transport system permease protein